MSQVTIANTDFAILAAVRAALAAATAGGETIFAAVSVATSRARAAECHLARSPVAVVRYVTTREDDGPEQVRGGQVELELLLATMAAAGSADEADRLQQLLRLKNAAINAVETDPPPDARAWGDADHYHRAIEWAPCEIDADAERPWALCRLRVKIGFLLDAPTAH